MNLPLNCSKYFQRLGRISGKPEMLRSKAHPFNLFVLLKQDKNNCIKHASQIRFLFTEDFLGISVLRHKQLLADKEVSELKINPEDLRKSIIEKLPREETTLLKIEGKF